MAQRPSESGKTLTIRVGTRQLAIPAGDVAEIVRLPKLTRVPHTPRSLVGVVNLRGNVVPVLSLARLLNEREDALSPVSRIVMLDRASPIGLLVDEVVALGLGSDDEDGVLRLIDLDRLLADTFAALNRKSSDLQVVDGPAAAETVPDHLISLLTFGVGGQDYALPLEHVSEVMALPRSIATMPGNDEAAVGVASLRGDLLPLLSLRVLLGLAPDAGSEKARVIVVKMDDVRIGIVVDHLARILHAEDDSIGPVPAVLNRGAGETQIDAMLRLKTGALVSILSPERLLKDDVAADAIADGRRKEAEEMIEDEAVETERFVIFRLGDETYGLPIAVVDEVVRLQEPITRIPKAPAFVEGVMNLRGKIIPLIDQRSRFDMTGGQPATRRRVLITKVRGIQAGFIVDAVSRIADLPSHQLSPTPDLSTEGNRLFDRVASSATDGGMILLVDPEALLDRVETDLLSAMSRAEETPAAP